MIEIEIKIKVVEDSPQALNHVDILTRDCERVLQRFHVGSIQRIEYNVIGRTLVGTHRKLICKFPCSKVKANFTISQESRKLDSVACTPEQQTG